ncbi:hypothetical protein ACLX1H_009702 [Fusarium chlamydosporum]
MASDGGTPGGTPRGKTSASHPRPDRSRDSPLKRSRPGSPSTSTSRRRSLVQDQATPVPEERPFSTLSDEKKIDFLAKKGLDPGCAEALVRDRSDKLSLRDLKYLDEQTVVDLESLGLAHIVREARGRVHAEKDTDETFWDPFTGPSTDKLTLRHIDLIARAPFLLDGTEDNGLMMKVAVEWLEMKPSIRRPNPDLKATNRQYEKFEDILYQTLDLSPEMQNQLLKQLELGPDPVGTGLFDFGPLPEPEEDDEEGIDHDGIDEEGIDHEDSAGEDVQYSPEPEPTPRDRAREAWEYQKIDTAIRDKGSLTHKQIEWLAGHLAQVRSMHEIPLQTLCHSRALQIVTNGGNPLELKQDTLYTQLNELLMGNPKWNDIARAARHLIMLLDLHARSKDNPLGIGGTREASEHRGRSPPAEVDYFELTAFERCYQSATRDHSREADARTGQYHGRRGTAIRAPEKHGPQPGDNQILMDLDIHEMSDITGADPTEDLIEQDHLMTLPGDGKESEVIATYEGKALRDPTGIAVRVGLDDTWFRKIWRIQSDGQRVTNGPMRVVRMKARCCQMFEPREGAPQLQERLSIVPPPAGEHVTSSYVGVSGISAQLVFIRPRLEKGTKKPATYTGPFDDDFVGFDFKNEPSQTMAGKNTILSESCLIPGNLARIKKFLAKKTSSFGAEPDPIRATIRQNQMALTRIPPTPLQHISLESDLGVPDISNFYNHDGVDTHFMLKLLPLSAFTVPEELVIRIQAFLSAHPLDPMSVNVAIQATGVYLRLRNDLQLGAEGMAYHKKSLKHPVPSVDLDVFVLMYPHWLRFTENMKMTRHMHPFRFIALAYRLDTKSHKSHLAQNGTLNVEKVQQLFDLMKSSACGIPAHLDIPVLPASMPGTTMKWPTGVTVGTPPSKELATLCLLDDIRTLGFPSYHNPRAATQLVAIPESLARNMGVKAQKFYVKPVPAPEFWNPNMHGSLVAQTGNAESIGPVFKPLVGAKMGPRSQIDGILGEANPEWLNHVLPHPVEDLMSRTTIKAITRRNVRRLELARKTGVKLEQMRWNPEELVLTWDGIQSEVISKITSGSLPALRKADLADYTDDEVVMLDEDEDAPPENAAFHQDPAEVALLSPNDAKALHRLLDGIHIHAMDWEPLRRALGTEAPLVKDVITHLHRVYSDLLREVIMAGIPFWEPELSNKGPNELAMKCAPFHLARLAGTIAADEMVDPLDMVEAVDPQMPHL